MEEGIPNRRLRNVRHKAQRRWSGMGKKSLSLSLLFCLICVPPIGQNQQRIVSKRGDEMYEDQTWRHRAKQKEGHKNGLGSCQQEESRVKYLGIKRKQQQSTNLEFCITEIILHK